MRRLDSLCRNWGLVCDATAMAGLHQAPEAILALADLVLVTLFCMEQNKRPFLSRSGSDSGAPVHRRGFVLIRLEAARRGSSHISGASAGCLTSAFWGCEVKGRPDAHWSASKGGLVCIVKLAVEVYSPMGSTRTGKQASFPVARCSRERQSVFHVVL